MELVPLVCLSLAAWSGVTSADGRTVVAQEDGKAVLSCSLGHNTQGLVFSWSKGSERKDVFSKGDHIYIGPDFKDRVSHFPEALQSGNASIVISPAKVSDTGNYTCEIAGQPPETRAIISLTVEQILKDRRAEKTKGAPGKPTIRTIGPTKGGMLLQCEVLGASPQPHVEWRDSAGTVLQAEKPQVTRRHDGKYDTVLNIIVTKSDNFSCNVTQKDIGHQTWDQTFAQPMGSSNGLVAGLSIVLTLTVVAVVIYVLNKKGHIELKSKKEGSDEQQESVALKGPVPGTGPHKQEESVAL